MTTFDFTSIPQAEPAVDYAVPYSAEPLATANEPTAEPTPEIPVAQPAANTLEMYSFYVDPDSLRMPSYAQYDPDLYLDITVKISGPMGKTYNVTKRVKFCKNSLLAQAECSDAQLNAAATFVESVESTESKHKTQRMLELAGINHPKNYVS